MPSVAAMELIDVAINKMAVRLCVVLEDDGSVTAYRVSDMTAMGPKSNTVGIPLKVNDFSPTSRALLDPQLEEAARYFSNN